MFKLDIKLFQQLSSFIDHCPKSGAKKVLLIKWVIHIFHWKFEWPRPIYLFLCATVIFIEFNRNCRQRKQFFNAIPMKKKHRERNAVFRRKGSSINHVVNFLGNLPRPPFMVNFTKIKLCNKMVIWLTPSPSTIHVVYGWPLSLLTFLLGTYLRLLGHVKRFLTLFL